MEFSPIDFRNYTLTCEDKDNIPIIWNGEAPKARKHRSFRFVQNYLQFLKNI